MFLTHVQYKLRHVPIGHITTVSLSIFCFCQPLPTSFSFRAFNSWVFTPVFLCLCLLVRDFWSAIYCLFFLPEDHRSSPFFATANCAMSVAAATNMVQLILRDKNYASRPRVNHPRGCHFFWTWPCHMNMLSSSSAAATTRRPLGGLTRVPQLLQFVGHHTCTCST